MMNDFVSTGLDIGSKKVCAVIGAYQENGIFKILGLGNSFKGEVISGSICNISATSDAVQEAIENAEMVAGEDVREVTVGIGGTHLACTNNRGVCSINRKTGEVSQEDLDNAIDNALALVLPIDKEIIHSLPQDFIVDNQDHIKNPFNMKGQRLEAKVHVIIGSTGFKGNLINCINRACCSVKNMVVNSLVSSSLILDEDEKELGVLMLDIGAGTTEICAYISGVLVYTAVLPMAGDSITSDIASTLSCAYQDAEKLKFDLDTACSAKIDPDLEFLLPGVGGRPAIYMDMVHLSKIVEARLLEIFERIKEDLDKRGILANLNGGVVLTGGTANLTGIDEVAQDVFNMSVRIGFPRNVVAKDTQWLAPEYTTAIALAMYGTGDQIKDRSGAFQSMHHGGEKNSIWNRFKGFLKEFV